MHIPFSLQSPSISLSFLPLLLLSLTSLPTLTTAADPTDLTVLTALTPPDFITNIAPPGPNFPNPTSPLDEISLLLALLRGIEFYALQPYTNAPAPRCDFDYFPYVRIVPYVKMQREADWQGRTGLWALYECAKKVLAQDPPVDHPPGDKEGWVRPARCEVVYPAGKGLGILLFYSLQEEDVASTVTAADVGTEKMRMKMKMKRGQTRMVGMRKLKRSPSALALPAPVPAVVDDKAVLADAALSSTTECTDTSSIATGPDGGGDVQGQGQGGNDNPSQKPFLSVHIGDIGRPLAPLKVALAISEAILQLASQVPRPEYITRKGEFESTAQGIYISVQPASDAKGFQRPQYAHLIKGLRQLVVTMKDYPGGKGWGECDFVVVLREASERVVLSGRVRVAGPM